MTDIISSALAGVLSSILHARTSSSALFHLSAVEDDEDHPAQVTFRDDQKGHPQPAWEGLLTFIPSFVSPLSTDTVQALAVVEPIGYNADVDGVAVMHWGRGGACWGVAVARDGTAMFVVEGNAGRPLFASSLGGPLQGTANLAACAMRRYLGQPSQGKPPRVPARIAAAALGSVAGKAVLAKPGQLASAALVIGHLAPESKDAAAGLCSSLILGDMAGVTEALGAAVGARNDWDQATTVIRPVLAWSFADESSPEIRAFVRCDGPMLGLLLDNLLPDETVMATELANLVAAAPPGINTTLGRWSLTAIEALCAR